MNLKHEKIKNPYLSLLISIIIFHIIFALCFGYFLFHHSMHQTINTIGIFSEHINTSDMNHSINRILSETSSDTYQAGISALQMAGYQNTYSDLFFNQWIAYAVFFTLLFFALSVSCFCIYICQKNSYCREIQNLLKWANDMSSDSAGIPPSKYLPFSMIRSIHLLKNYIQRQSVLHEEDSARIIHYMENISHQLKTPLAVISAVCERLSMHYPHIEKKLSVCIAQTAKMTMLIQDFLQLGKFDCNKQQMQFEYTSAANLLETVTNNLDLIAQNKSLAFCIYGENDILWFCDVFWMEEIIGNILKNCIEHSENGKIHIFYKQNNNQNEIVIRDCGIGLKTGFEKKIFERYSSSGKTAAEGSGLGLSIAQQAIRLHFGAITAANSTKGGVEFRISFPQLDPETIYPAFKNSGKIS